MKFLKWQDDKWNSTNGTILAYDKIEHVILACAGVLFTLFYWGFSWRIIGAWIAVGFWYEIYNGLVPYDGKNIEGFSIKDFIADVFGVGIGLIIYGIVMQIRAQLGVL